MFNKYRQFLTDLLLCEIEYFILLYLVELKDIEFYENNIRDIKEVIIVVICWLILYMLLITILTSIFKIFKKDISIICVAKNTIIFFMFIQVLLTGIVAVGLKQ